MTKKAVEFVNFTKLDEMTDDERLIKSVRELHTKYKIVFFISYAQAFVLLIVIYQLYKIMGILG